MKRVARIPALILAATLVGSASADAQILHGLTPKLDSVLTAKAQEGGSQRVRVIVSGRSGLLGLLRTKLTLLGGKVLGELKLIDALVAEVPAGKLALLAADALVVQLSLDAPVAPTAVVDEPYSLRGTLGLDGVSATGRGVGVAVVDSGVAPHADLIRRLQASFDFRGSLYGKTTAAADPFGHGTHVAGIIASAGNFSTGGLLRGVSPDVRVVSLRVLESNGQGFTSDVIEAVQFVLDNRATLDVQVLNLSLGHPILEPAARDPLVRAAEAAVRAGLVVVTSAGNRGINAVTGQPGYGGINSPGNAPSVITVGALDTQATLARLDDTVAPYSSRGPTWYDGYAKPDLLAPGHRVVSTASAGSTLLTSYPSTERESKPQPYQELSGTSMAAPVVSGVVSLMIEANRRAHPGAPDLTPNAIKAMLQYSAVRLRNDLGLPHDTLTQGSGGINAAGAIALAHAADPSTPVGSYWTAGPVPVYSTIGGESFEWSQRLLWGDRELLGDSVLFNAPAWATTVVWGDTLVWGSTLVWGHTVVWGDTLVWGHTMVWGDTIVWGHEAVGQSNDGGSTIAWGLPGTQTTTVWAPLGGLTGLLSGLISGVLDLVF